MSNVKHELGGGYDLEGGEYITICCHCLEEVEPRLCPGQVESAEPMLCPG